MLISSQELKDINEKPLPGLSVEVKDDNMFEWKCSIKADSDSPYKNGTFHFNLSLPPNYPFKAPTALQVTFTTKIYHPGINEEGAICVPVLRDEWKPTVTLATVLSIIQEKLNNPSPDDPFEPDIAALLKNDHAKFLATAKEWTKNKKSDAHRPQLPSTLHSSQSSLDTVDALPELPPTNDFRTSLILPDLSRRFSLLRESTGDPVLFDQLRSRLADQRARGAENQITEEEEDMLLETLGRIRSRGTATPDRSQENVGEGEDGARGSVRSMTTSVSSVTSSPSRPSKRYSNNLFGSGRLRDYAYLKSVGSSRGSGGSTRTASLTPTEASTKELLNASQRPVTPDNTATPPVQSSPSDLDSVLSTPTPSSSYVDGQLQVISAAEYRLQKTMGPSNLKRASLALEKAIKEIEDEVEDEILVPRSPPIPRANLEQHAPEVRNSNASNASSVFQGGMAISIDQTIHDEFSERRASPIPARTIPGYVPGMPRPMTPRDFDFDEQRSHSTTPRAQSPFPDPPASPTLVSITTSKLKRESTSSTAKSSPITPVGAAPLFLQRTTNGRYTPDDSPWSGAAGDTSDIDNSLSALLNRRRPASPLSGLSYRPMAVSNRPSSRPGTPSNVIWTTNPNHKNSHSRNNSWTTDGARSLRSPALPDSPMLEAGQSAPPSFSSIPSSPPKESSSSLARPNAYIPEIELGSPILAAIHAPRSPTPTQTAPRSPTSPVFSNFELSQRNGSRRSSRQNPPSSPFNISAFPTIGLAPRANSSRSSLDSVGSSFHSWDEPDQLLSVFSDSKEQQPAWHDFYADKSSSATPSGSSPEGDDCDAEEVIMRYGGLKKVDIAAIQEKLVTAAFTKIANTDPRDRAPSAMRRRRPSTSQSNYSRITSPPPQMQPPSSPSTFTSDDHFSKASALLNSVVESIKDHPAALNTSTSSISPPSSDEISPTTRRNRDLAHVLFGTEDDGKDESSKEDPIMPIPDPDPAPVVSNPATPTPPATQFPSALPPPIPVAEPAITQPFTIPYLHRNPSTNRIPQTPQEEAALAREVQQKAEAAMIALKKDPSRVNLGDSLKQSPSVRKKIDTSQISTPTLVSTTTNVDTLPIRSPSLSSSTNSAPSKLGSRFKKLRGSLRAKTTVEENASLESVKTPPATQTAHYDPAKLNVSSLSSATESGRFKVPVPSPPASAGPGLKGFMARFRNKQRMSEMPPVGERLALAVTSPTTPRVITRHPDLPVSLGPMYSRFPPANPPPAPAPAPQQQAQVPDSPNSLEASKSAAALEQLFAAANNLGLDQGALMISWLVRRPPRPVRFSQETIPWLLLLQDQVYLKRVLSKSVTSEAQAQIKRRPQRITAVCPTNNRTGRLRKPEGQNETPAKAVVRRTIIYANDAADFAALIQRKNSTRRRRASATSVSSRSIHDRAPTPPPPKAPTVKRFSADGMPPMPQLPNFLGQADKMLNVPSTSTGGPIEKSNSTYDSLYDMYAGESRGASMVATDHTASDPKGENTATSDPGPALEVIELANGETVWSIINSLRDADEDSIYSGRASFASEYSSREPVSDTLQAFVKDHNRSGSRGSVSSFVSRKKTQPGKIRPETKVFYSSSAQIGRLIENLSQGADAGSFNFLPNLPSRGPGHSTSSSLSTNDINWTVEERLERMLGQMNSS
ncbi:hypothetical protein NLJ89_g3468 [Agrocybe chaxingu]|uniref:UBC core domain-containing protein n=1 Tax=Agrocybe chaxingu TaxID=84603 RepID=A0A9W8K2F3_9AGAR|nr:hypothetical protein NLJ89_g3468 [Agrocybe chaxingu]